MAHDLKSTIKELKRSSTKLDCLKKAYLILTKKYRGGRVRTYTQFYRLFTWDVNQLWMRSGFLQCAHLVYLMRYLLLSSGLFKKEDIKLKWTLIYYFSPHIYLNITIGDGKSIDVDLWGHGYGIKFGDHAYGFHSGRIFH